MADDPVRRRPGGEAHRDRDRRDEAGLRALSDAYAHAADARDGDSLASLFTDDGALVVPRVPTDLRPVVTRRGHDALAQVAEALGRYERTLHVVASTRFTLAGDQASGEVRCVAHHVSPPTDTVWFIRYRDQYRRSGPDWKFWRRELHLQWVEEHPVTLLGPLPDGA